MRRSSISSAIAQRPSITTSSDRVITKLKTCGRRLVHARRACFGAVSLHARSAR
jgi:hypothetical protein